MRQAHADRWFIVFDTLTLTNNQLESLYDNITALRACIIDNCRMLLNDEVIKTKYTNYKYKQ